MKAYQVPGQDALIRQLQQAQQLQAAPAPQGQAVGRFYVPPSVTQRLASILKNVKGDEMARSAEAGMAQARQESEQATQRAMLDLLGVKQPPTTQAGVEQAFAQRQAGNRESLGLPDGGWGAQATPVPPPSVQTGPVDMPRQPQMDPQMIARLASMVTSGDPVLQQQAMQMWQDMQQYMRTRGDQLADRADDRGYQEGRDATQFEQQKELLNIRAQNATTPLERTLMAAGIQRGSPEWVQAMQGAVQKATTHAPAANVNVSPTVNVEADKSLSREVGGIMTEERSKISGAVNLARSADRMLNAINSGDVIAGPTANARLYMAQIGQMLGVGGQDTEDTILRTRRVIRELADAAVEARQLLAGQGQVTENEAKAVEKARSGQLDELTIPEIRAIAELNIKHAHFLNQGYQQRFNALPENLRPFYSVTGADNLPAIPAPLGDVNETDFDRAMRKYGQ